MLAKLSPSETGLRSRPAPVPGLNMAPRLLVETLASSLASLSLVSSGRVGDSGMEAKVGSWLTMDIVVVECGVSLECVVKVIVEDQKLLESYY